MTATSGPGFSLMAETLGLAVMAELPLVVVDCQRVGPSTGIPTRTEQADLNMALYGRHGDAPCVVLAPTSIDECLALAPAAFNIADEYRTPVVLLSDQYLAQGVTTVGALPTVARITNGAHGSADISSPLQQPPRQMTGLVHLPTGEPSSNPSVHAGLCRQRQAKLARLAERCPLHVQYEDDGPAPNRVDLGLLTWGSSFGPCCAVVDVLRERGIRASVFAPQLVYPLPRQPLAAWLQRLLRLAVVELNFSGQFWHYLRGELDLPGIPSSTYHRAGGAAFTVTELLAAIEPLLAQ
jgi:2-oxoglutarate ferredoxin oxidoreductase subunit alpha